jgi:putative component of toxin-antitoxin plasmid stabilization module
VTWTVEFFEDDNGRQPAREWLDSLDKDKRDAAIAAIEVWLEVRGLAVCDTEHGKPLGRGLFELRIRHDEAVTRAKAGEGIASKKGREMLLRIFWHAYGNKIILLLGGYDKGASPGKRRQDQQIELAHKRLRAFKQRQRGK